MHTFIKSESGPLVFYVGYYHPNPEQLHEFIVLFEYKTSAAAVAAVNYLNGGQAFFTAPNNKMKTSLETFRDGLPVVLALMAARRRTPVGQLEIVISGEKIQVALVNSFRNAECLTNPLTVSEAIDFLNSWGLNS
jgi:hypothetical protein